MPMKQSIYLQPYPRKSTYLYPRPSKNVVGPTRKAWGKSVLVWGIALALALPIFRSGLRSNLTLFEFVIVHTIFGPEPEYIPKEIYSDIKEWE